MVKYVSLVLASVMLLMTVVGACLAMAMQHDIPVMGDCLHITSRSVVCPMGLVEHVGAWKSALLSQAVNFFAIFFVVLSVVAIIVSRSFDAARASPKQAWRNGMLLAFFLPLRHLFSRGILHPKVFERIG